jgi:hypothetical protein
LPKCREVLALVLTFVLASCGGDEACPILPPPECLQSTAVIANVSSSVAGRALDSVFVQVGKPATVSHCIGSPNGTCTISILGDVGTYELDFGAAGFQTTHRSVKVEPGDPSPCAVCYQVKTVTISVALVPTG